MSKLVLLVEVLGLLLIVVGVAAYSVPVAVILAGVATVAVCEVHGADAGRGAKR